jgi:hypothetical protein
LDSSHDPDGLEQFQNEASARVDGVSAAGGGEAEGGEGVDGEKER